MKMAKETQRKKWFDAIFGIWGVSLMIVLANGIIFGLISGIFGAVIWSINTLYFLYKMNGEEDK